jgi:hypothetical protein
MLLDMRDSVSGNPNISFGLGLDEFGKGVKKSRSIWRIIGDI